MGGGAYNDRRYWRGSWPLSPRSQRSQQFSAETRYDQVPVPGRRSSGGSAGQAGNPQPAEAAPEGSGEGSEFRKELQRLLTQAKRADGKIYKLQDDREHRRQQWEYYERGMKLAFLKQQQAFEADLKRLDAEIQTAGSTGREAAERMQALALYGMLPKTEVDAPEEAAWDNMMANCAVEPERPASGFLAAAMEAVRALGATAHHALPRRLRHPWERHLGHFRSLVLHMWPPLELSRGLWLIRPSPLLVPEPDSHQAPGSTAKVKQRPAMPVPPTGGLSLDQKLEHRRAMELLAAQVGLELPKGAAASALGTTGLPPQPPDTDMMAADTTAEPTVTKDRTTVDVFDLSDSEPSQHATERSASPGLGKMG
ncbi:unnamed protein product [Symbiodinium sp. CCMP2592]|nr:unnamed protein product [Symbiodinium sp. CCMP2592]